jgi:TolA-binding protein
LLLQNHHLYGQVEKETDRLRSIELRLERLEATLNTFMQQVDKRFEQIDKRIDDLNRKIDHFMTFLWIISGIFTAIMIAAIGFAIWDRRTAIYRAKQEAIEEVDRKWSLTNVVRALREYALGDQRLADILKKYGLM